MKKISKAYKKRLVINTEDYLKKKEIRKKKRREIGTRIMSEENRQELREQKNNPSCSISKEKMQQQVEQLIAQIKELLKRLKS